jgi:ATP-binding cassette subfamily F protein uup
MPLIHLKDVSLAFGDRPLLDHIELVIEPGERIGLIGRNGEGKSSLLAVLAGAREADDGVVARSQGLRVAYATQEPHFRADDRACDRVAAAFGTDYVAWQHAHQVSAILAAFGVAADAPLGSLSGGQLKRVQLAAAWVTEPQLLLLDEPTNHLDLAAIAALEERLVRLRGSAVVVSHDRTFLDRVATRVVELDRGVLASYPGNFARYRALKAQQLAAESAANVRFDKLLKAEEIWIRRGIEARRTRDQGRVRRLEALRVQRALRRERIGKVRLQLDAGEHTGKVIAELTDVGFAYPDKPPLFAGFNAVVTRGDRIGIVGGNGVGKSTLIKLLLGDLAPTSGRLRRPAYTDNVISVAYLDQQRAALDESAQLADMISPGSDYVEVAGARRHVISYLEDFLFPPERARAQVKSLSGGERARLLLARLFARPANVVVLDEPTNDLDIETIELLEERLQDYPGTVLLVSHDRAFLNGVATQIYAFDADGVVREYPGGFDDWLRQRPDSVPPAVDAREEAHKGKPAPVTAPADPRPAGQPRTRTRLSYQEARELDALPGLIEALEREQAQLNAALADADLFVRDPGRGRATGERLTALETELTQAYARWDALESKQRALAGA